MRFPVIAHQIPSGVKYGHRMGNSQTLGAMSRSPSHTTPGVEGAIISDGEAGRTSFGPMAERTSMRSIAGGGGNFRAPPSRQPSRIGSSSTVSPSRQPSGHASPKSSIKGSPSMLGAVMGVGRRFSRMMSFGSGNKAQSSANNHQGVVPTDASLTVSAC